MAIKPIAKSYWRLIKIGNRTFSSVRNEAKDDVKFLAKDDVVHGVITEEQYKFFIGEEYAM
ncbi:MAG: hypothetical protein ACI4TP_02100 [Anaerotignum sp.]